MRASSGAGVPSLTWRPPYVVRVPAEAQNHLSAGDKGRLRGIRLCTGGEIRGSHSPNGDSEKSLGGPRAHRWTPRSLWGSVQGAGASIQGPLQGRAEQVWARGHCWSAGWAFGPQAALLLAVTTFTGDSRGFPSAFQVSNAEPERFRQRGARVAR